MNEMEEEQEYFSLLHSEDVEYCYDRLCESLLCPDCARKRDDFVVYDDEDKPVHRFIVCCDAPDLTFWCNHCGIKVKGWLLRYDES